MTPSARFNRIRVIAAAAIACVALAAAAVVGYLAMRAPPSPTAVVLPPAPRPAPLRPAGPAERALVAPLREGASLGGFEVVAIHAVSEEGTLRVVCARDRAVVRLDVALAAEEGPSPPAVAGAYAVYYGLKNATPEEGERLAGELAAIVKANAAVPTPPGMTPFVPRSRDLPI